MRSECRRHQSLSSVWIEAVALGIGLQTINCVVQRELTDFDKKGARFSTFAEYVDGRRVRCCLRSLRR